jgi:hypothetical protein
LTQARMLKSWRKRMSRSVQISAESLLIKGLNRATQVQQKKNPKQRNWRSIQDLIVHLRMMILRETLLVLWIKVQHYQGTLLMISNINQVHSWNLKNFKHHTLESETEHLDSKIRPKETLQTSYKKMMMKMPSTKWCLAKIQSQLIRKRETSMSALRCSDLQLQSLKMMRKTSFLRWRVKEMLKALTLSGRKKN